MSTPGVPARHQLKIRLVDINGDPLANVKCDVETGKDVIHEGLVTDASGLVSFAVPANVDTFLTVHPFNAQSTETLVMRIQVEAFGGADTVVGARARLNNLGYMAQHDVGPMSGTVDDLFQRGLDRFRFANGFVNDAGEPVGPIQAPFDQATKDRLEDAHDRANGALIKTP